MIALTLAIVSVSVHVRAFDYRESHPSSLVPLPLAAESTVFPYGVSNPALFPFIGAPHLSSHGSIPYGLTELISTGVRTGFAMKGVGAIASWRMFGLGDQYVEHTAEAGIGYMPIPQFSFGAVGIYRRLLIRTAESSLSAGFIDAGIGGRVAPFPWISAAFRLEHIWSLIDKRRKDILFPSWSAGISLSPFKGFSIQYNILKTSFGYVNTVTASAAILKCLAVHIGYAREIMTSSAAVSFVYRHLAVSYGIRYHQHLGFTHSIGLTLSLGEMFVDPLPYGDLFSKIRGTRQPIDVNACSIDELAALPGVGPLRAERIMRHRLTVGPVSRRDLIRIGMTEREIDGIMPRITGLVPEKAHDEKTNRGHSRASDRKKIIFMKLIDIGLPPASALTAAEMAVAGDHRLPAFIDSLRGLSGETKRKAVEACGFRR